MKTPIYQGPVIEGTEGFTFFWGVRNLKTHTMSNWHTSPFVLNGVDYINTEQYMMLGKAMLFMDYASLLEMQKTNNPYSLKKLGRKVKGFDQSVWESRCLEYMIPALLAKFVSNKDCFHQLMSTGNTMIVEASSSDKVWGIGMSEADDGIEDQNNWPEGVKNYLGWCLTVVREIIRNQEDFEDLKNNFDFSDI